VRDLVKAGLGTWFVNVWEMEDMTYSNLVEMNAKQGAVKLTMIVRNYYYDITHDSRVILSATRKTIHLVYPCLFVHVGLEIK